jgi:hypothetical protein
VKEQVLYYTYSKLYNDLPLFSNAKTIFAIILQFTCRQGNIPLKQWSKFGHPGEWNTYKELERKVVFFAKNPKRIMMKRISSSTEDREIS